MNVRNERVTSEQPAPQSPVPARRPLPTKAPDTQGRPGAAATAEARLGHAARQSSPPPGLLAGTHAPAPPGSGNPPSVPEAAGRRSGSREGQGRDAGPGRAFSKAACAGRRPPPSAAPCPRAERRREAGLRPRNGRRGDGRREGSSEPPQVPAPRDAWSCRTPPAFQNLPRAATIRLPRPHPPE